MQKYSVIARDLLPLPETLPPFREVGVYLITDVLADHRAVEEELETERIRLAGCGVAAMANTEETRKQRIGKDSPYWSASYGDVCAAVDREMSLREERDRLKSDNEVFRTLAKKSKGFLVKADEQIAALTAEITRMKEHTWCAYCGLEIHIDDEAATKISEHIMVCERHPLHIALADNDRLTAEVAKLQSDIREMVNKDADQHLEGYRELGRKAADAENAKDKLTAEVAGWKQIHEADLADNQKICATVDRLMAELDSLRENEGLKAEVKGMNQLDYASLEASKLLFDAGIVLETEKVHFQIGDVWFLRDRMCAGSNLIPSKICIPAPSMVEVWREIGCGHRVLIEHTLSADRQTMLTYAWIPGAYGNSLKGFRDANPTDCLINLLAWVRKEHP